MFVRKAFDSLTYLDLFMKIRFKIIKFWWLKFQKFGKIDNVKYLKFDIIGKLSYKQKLINKLNLKLPCTYCWI